MGKNRDHILTFKRTRESIFITYIKILKENAFYMKNIIIAEGYGVSFTIIKRNCFETEITLSKSHIINKTCNN